MKILLIHHRIPYPLYSGMDKIRYNLIRTLKKEHHVTLIAPVDEYTSPEAADHIRGLCDELITVPVKNRILATQKSRLLWLWRNIDLLLFRVPISVFNETHSAVSDKVKKVCSKGDYDIAQATSEVTAVYLKSAKKARCRVLGPMDDVTEAARTNLLVSTAIKERLIWWMRYRARKYFQPYSCLKSDWALFHSIEDMKRVENLAGRLHHAHVLRVTPEPDDNPRQTLTQPLEIQEPNSLVFVGGLGSNFNTDSVLFFYHDIFHLVLKRNPNARLYVVGQNPPKRIKDLEKDGNVIITGTVPDVRPYIERAAVYISPIRAGTGFKTKTVEALSLGKAIVTTMAGTQGMWNLGKDVLFIEDNPTKFAKNIVKLLQNDKMRVEIGRRARKLYDDSYAFDVVAPHTLAVYREIEKSL